MSSAVTSSLMSRHPAAPVLCLLLCACSGDAGPGMRMSTSADQSITIDFKTSPNPPRSGANEVAVEVRNADGTAVTGADVSATFYMGAMPSMSMPEMRNIFTLKPAKAGTYVGQGSLEMGGTWEVTVNVSRDGVVVAKGRSTVIAK